MQLHLGGVEDGRSASRAAEFPDGNAEPLRLVGEVVLDSVPGKCKTPIGSSSSMASLRLNGAALACFVQSGLKAICGTLRVVAHLEAISSAPFGDPPWIRTMSGCLA